MEIILIFIPFFLLHSNLNTLSLWFLKIKIIHVYEYSMCDCVSLVYTGRRERKSFVGGGCEDQDWE